MGRWSRAALPVGGATSVGVYYFFVFIYLKLVIKINKSYLYLVLIFLYIGAAGNFAKLVNKKLYSVQMTPA